MIWVCKNCTLNFESRKSKRIFCSRRCVILWRNKYNNPAKSPQAREKNRMFHLGKPTWNKGRKLPQLSGSNHHMWGKHHSEVTKQKLSKAHKGRRHSIKTEFSKGFIPWNKGKKMSDETRKKCSISKVGKRTGIDNPSWKGGITPFIQKVKRLPEYTTWFRSILTRDRFICRKCKNYKSPGITAHHLKSFAYLIRILQDKTLTGAKQFKELWDLNNGVTLCKSCHQSTPNYSYRASYNPIDTNLYL